MTASTKKKKKKHEPNRRIPCGPSPLRLHHRIRDGLHDVDGDEEMTDIIMTIVGLGVFFVAFVDFVFSKNWPFDDE